jgi:glycosyltransferase involved in cell wall biosynthesis
VRSRPDAAVTGASIVIATRDRPESLRRSLAALRQEADGAEIIVVDNAPTAGVADIARDFGAAYLAEPQPGLCRARNRGACAASGEVVAFIDDDAVPQAGWLEAHMAAQRDPRIGATTGRVLAAPVGSRVARAYEDEDLGGAPMRFARGLPDWFGRANFGGVGIGTNMAFRRACFATGWGFSEGLGYGTAGPSGDENLAFYDLLAAGWAIAYVPEAVVHHDAPLTEAAIAVRRSMIVRDGALYALAVAVERRPARGPVLHYAFRAARKGRPSWRRTGGRGPGTGALLFAAAAALPRYARARHAAGGPITSPSARPPLSPHA